MDNSATIKIKFPGYKLYSFKVNVPNGIIDMNDMIIQVGQQVLSKSRIVRKSKEAYPMQSLLIKKLPKALKDAVNKSGKIGIEYSLPTQASPDNYYASMRELNRRSLKEAVKTIVDGKEVYHVESYRVGRSFNHRVALDIDSKDFDNALTVKNEVSNLLGYPFTLLQTANGYQLIGSKKYDDKDGWLFDNCKILKSDLTPDKLNTYIEQLHKFDKALKGSGKSVSNEIRKTHLCDTRMNIDIGFTLLSIRKGTHTLRVSTKRPDEIPLKVIA